MSAPTVNLNGCNIGILNAGCAGQGESTNPMDTPVEVTESDSNQEELYYQKGSDAPKALVIANYNFKMSAKLSGYEADAENLEEFLENDLGCGVYLRQNLTGKKMRQKIKQFADETLVGKERYCAVFLLSHGVQGDCVVGTDEELITSDEIISLFNNRNSKLQNMPKLFFFQFCRGTNVDEGVPLTVAASASNGNRTLPLCSDMLVMYATAKKEVAFVDGDGSWLVKELIDVFKRYNEREDLLSMLTIVNKGISKRQVEYSKEPNFIGAKCMSEFKSTLTAKVSLRKTN